MCSTKNNLFRAALKISRSWFVTGWALLRNPEVESALCNVVRPYMINARRLVLASSVSTYEHKLVVCAWLVYMARVFDSGNLVILAIRFLDDVPLIVSGKFCAAFANDSHRPGRIHS